MLPPVVFGGFTTGVVFGGSNDVIAAVSLLSTGLAKEPKTEFQADIQMAKALSKSLLGVPAQRGGGEEAGDDVEGEPQDKEVSASRQT